MEARRLGVCSCDNLQATIRGKAGEIGQRNADLRSLHTELKALLGS